MHGYPTKPGASWYVLSFHRRSKSIEGCDPVLSATWLMMVCLDNDQHLPFHRGQVRFKKGSESSRGMELAGCGETERNIASFPQRLLEVHSDCGMNPFFFVCFEIIYAAARPLVAAIRQPPADCWFLSPGSLLAAAVAPDS
ncbi:hypothetical protein Acr_23g0001690 [Actinidia rufa]|uniref:Uncharacterized protein n=1 Tax=Actinidia rufa TaxID=165716 RepID=A0A7J0GM84_9ERIC|nr:hypothetical protein Acr_23g0001690 [Actinidia rufa]